MAWNRPRFLANTAIFHLSRLEELRGSPGAVTRAAPPRGRGRRLRLIKMLGCSNFPIGIEADQRA